MTPVETVLQFMDLINRRDADKLAELMTEDHLFVDSLGQSIYGREKMRAGWRGYYAFCPDYSISHDEILARGDLVAVFGAAAGTIAATRTTAAASRVQRPGPTTSCGSGKASSTARAATGARCRTGSRAAGGRRYIRGRRPRSRRHADKPPAANARAPRRSARAATCRT